MTNFKLTATLLCLCLCTLTFAEIETSEVGDLIIYSGMEHPVSKIINHNGCLSTHGGSAVCADEAMNCADPRYVGHTILETTQTSIKLKVQMAQNRSLRLSYFPLGNPSLVQYSGCEPTTNYGALGNEHVQTISGLTAGTAYTIVAQTSEDVSNNYSDCPILTWEDVSCPIVISTLQGGGNSGCTNVPEVVGLPYIAWSLNNQRMQNDKKRIAWSFKAERTETLTELALNQRVGTNYSSGNGGTLKYKFYNGPVTNLGSLIFESGIIVAHTNLYGSRPANTVQPSRTVNNASYQPFPVQVPVVEGQLYTIVVERQTPVANHISINGYILSDESRDFLYPALGLLDPIEWKIYVQADGASNWVRRTNNIALFSVGRADGTSYGNNYAEELAAPQADRLYNLSGADRFRWNINLPTPMFVEKVGLALVRQSGIQPVTIDVKNDNGTLLTTYVLDFSNLPIPGPNTTNLALNDWLLRHGRMVSLDVNTCLPAGQLYFEARTGNSTNFEIAGLRDGSDSGFFLPETLDNGYMEVSTNSGSSWSKPQQWSNTNVETVQPGIYIYGEFCNTPTCTQGCNTNAGTGNSVEICDSLATSSLDLFTELTGNPQTTGTWADLDNTNALTGSSLDLSVLAVGTYRFQYLVADAGCASDSTEVVVEIKSCPFVPTLQIQENQAGFCSADGPIESNHTGYTGTGFVNTDNLIGAGIDYAINVGSTGSYAFRWRHASNSVTNRTAKLIVNNVEQVANWDFNGTGAWSTWVTSNSVAVNLTTGLNLIRLEATQAEGLANIDWMEITGNNLNPGNCSGVPELQINLKVFLEGPFNTATGLMNTDLNQRSLFPISGQPYTIAPWNYQGTEGAGWQPGDYPTDVVDWVLVSLRTGVDSNTKIHQAAGLLKQDGTVEFLQGSAYQGNDPGPYYVLLEHRNHIGALSAQPLTAQNGVLTHDFTAQNSWIPSNGGFGQKQLPNGLWGMYAGDGDQLADVVSYDINGADRILWSIENGIFMEYRPSDYDLSGEVTGADRILWNGNSGINSGVPK